MISMYKNATSLSKAAILVALIPVFPSTGLKVNAISPPSTAVLLWICAGCIIPFTALVI